MRDYVDLQPGWRLRVVTPVLKSGGYLPQIREGPAEGRAIVLTTSDDFVGYEASYYAVKRRNGGGVRISFISAWVTEHGKTNRRPRPLVRLFDLPDTLRFVRLIYTVRVSQSDHDTAIVAASDQEELENLTARVRSSILGACRLNGTGSCMWYPKGSEFKRKKEGDHPNARSRSLHFAPLGMTGFLGPGLIFWLSVTSWP